MEHFMFNEGDLPTPEIRSPYYLTKLARLEKYLYNLLSQFQKDLGLFGVNPELLEKIQT